MFYDDDLGTENIFFPVCLISEYASFTINVYLYSIHLGIWNVTAVFQFPFNLGHYMRTLFFDIMQAEDVLFICILSSKPETRTTSRKWREAAMQVSKILLSL